MTDAFCAADVDGMARRTGVTAPIVSEITASIAAILTPAATERTGVWVVARAGASSDMTPGTALGFTQRRMRLAPSIAERLLVCLAVSGSGRLAIVARRGLDAWSVGAVGWVRRPVIRDVAMLPPAPITAIGEGGGV